MDVTQPERGTNIVAPALMAVGGAIGLVGSTLTWATVSINRRAIPGQARMGGQGQLGGQGSLQGRPAGRAFTIHGLDTTSGRLILALCVALVVVAVFGWLAPRLWFQLGAIGLVLGVIVLVLATVDLASPGPLFGVVGTRLAAAGIPLSVGIGLWLVLAGSLAAVGAASFWLVATTKWWARPAQAASAPAPAPPPPQDPGPAEQPTTQLPPLTEPGLSPE